MKRPPVPAPPRDVVAPADGSPARWEPFLETLSGLGLLSTQMNEHRLYLPVELRRRLGKLLELPWVISYWCEGCLRAVPQHLWRDYLRAICDRLDQSRVHGWLDEAIVQPASSISLEQGGRWNLPPALTTLSRIGGGALCLLCASEGGLEVWEANAKHRRLRVLAEELLPRVPAVPPGAPAPGAVGSLSAPAGPRLNGKAAKSGVPLPA